jgi:hypothetical protein
MALKVANLGLVAVATAGTIAAIFYCEPLIKRVVHGGLLAPRHGRVVDAATGAGLADVIVIRKWLTGERCRAEKAALTDSRGFYDLPGAEEDVEFDRTWFQSLLLHVIPLPVHSPGQFHAGILLYKAGYVPEFGPEDAVPDNPHVNIPPVRMRAEPPDSERLLGYERRLNANLWCTFHGADVLPVKHHVHVHIAGQPWTDADKDPPPVLMCEGERVASALDCQYKGHPDLVKRAARELEAINLANRANEGAAPIR